METTVKIPNREIALAAFDRLRREKRKDAALRLAGVHAQRDIHIPRHR